MDRLSSTSSSSSYRTDVPALSSLPEENLVKIISLIDKVDNQTLSSLVQTCKDLWRIAGADSLRSYFYAARESFETSDNPRKVAVFTMLTQWIQTVSSQLPDESRWQILHHLAGMANIDIDVDEFSQLEQMQNSLEDLIKMTSDEIKLQSGLNSETPVDSIQIDILLQLQEISACLCKHYNNFFVDPYIAMVNSVRDELLSVIRNTQ